MRKFMWFGGLMAALFLGFGLVAHAEDQGMGDGGGKPGMDDHGDWGGKGHMADRWKKKLGLNDSQVTQLKDAFKKQQEEVKPLRDQVKIDVDTLQQKIDTKASDSEVQKQLDALSADRVKMEAKRKKFEEQLKTILTPTQQAKFVLGMKRRGMMMRGKWMHHGKDGMDHRGKKGKKGDAKKAPADDTGTAQ